MASIHRSETGSWRIRFRFGPPPDNRFQRACDTTDQHKAEAIRQDVEETIRLLEQARIHVPEGVEVGAFILSGGRLKATAPLTPPQKIVTLSSLFESDDAAFPEGAWEGSTVSTGAVHRRHLLRILGAGLDLRRSDLAERLQEYVNKRSKELWGGSCVLPKTIQKELETLRAIWNRSPHVKVADFPVLKKLMYSKSKEKGRFRTRQEIEEAVVVGGLSEEEELDLWESLFLTRAEVEQFLAFAQAHEAPAWFVPCLTLVADTGMRRSEALRSRREDILFRRGEVLIRERKRDRTKKETHRYVPLTPRLMEVMTDWFGRHPGGPFTLSIGGDAQLTWQTGTKAFRRLVDGSKWEKMKGFHVFRHSYASHLAAKGVSQGLIDEWMGHQTEAMRRRYRHLVPNEKQKALATLIGTD